MLAFAAPVAKAGSQEQSLLKSMNVGSKLILNKDFAVPAGHQCSGMMPYNSQGPEDTVTTATLCSDENVDFQRELKVGTVLSVMQVSEEFSTNHSDSPIHKEVVIRFDDSSFIIRVSKYGGSHLNLSLDPTLDDLALKLKDAVSIEVQE